MANSLSDAIKDRLTMDEVARFYGFEPNRAGFISCPFHHGDHTASLKIYTGSGGFHCHACGAGSSVVDFVMRLFDISFPQACLRLNSDFQLGLSAQRPDRVQASRIAQERAKAARERDAYEERYQVYTALHRAMWCALRDGTETPLYYEALRYLPVIENWFDEHPYREVKQN